MKNENPKDKYMTECGYYFCIGSLNIPSENDRVEGYYNYYTKTVGLLCGSNNIISMFGTAPVEDMHTLEEIEDVINHEVLHYVLGKVIKNEVSRALDTICHKKFLGLNLTRKW